LACQLVDLTSLIGHVRGSDTGHPDIPWQKLTETPADFYDTTEFAFPVALCNPESLSNINTIVICEFLLEKSSLLTVYPFRFFSRAELSATKDTKVDDKLVSSLIFFALI
jgi:hypothetical protein